MWCAAHDGGDHAPPEPLDDASIALPIAPDTTIDPKTGALTIEADDGGVIVQLNPSAKDAGDESSDFDENLVGVLPEGELGTIGANLIEGIEADIQSRQGWERQLTEAMTALGLDVEAVSSLDMATVSKIRHPVLLDAVLDFWAQFQAEFLPADGPCKIKVDEDETDEVQEEADRLERDINHFLTDVASEYYPDTSRAGIRIALIGGIVKKVYACPLRQRPVSEAVYLDDLIVSNDITDLDNAKRITHRLSYMKQDIEAMQQCGAWADVALGSPTSEPTQIEQKVGQIEGQDKTINLDQDRQYTIYETITKLSCSDPKASKEIPCPYKITIDKESHKILAMYRHWKEGDELYRPEKLYILWQYCPGLGWYPLGLGQILRNPAMTLTALWREMLDAGMYNQFPGTLHIDTLGRQDTNILRVMPGESKGIKAPPGMRIQDCVMPLPFQGVSPVLLQFAQHIEDRADKTAGKAAVPVGEGTANIPVGTVVAMIEQSTILMQAVHKGLHTSQKRELEMLKDLFVKDPEALTRFDNDPNKQPWTAEQLANHDLVPASDPNTPSHIHRIMQAQILGTVAQQTPGVYDPVKVADRILKTAGIHDVESLHMTPQPSMPPIGQPASDPAKMAEVQLKATEQQRKAASESVDDNLRMQELKANMANNEADRVSAEKIAVLKAETEKAKLMQTAQEKMANKQSLSGGLI